MLDFATPNERKRFRLDRFPATDEETQEWLFALTGFSAHRKIDSARDWLLLNTALNRGFGLGLEADAHGVRQLQMLSLMDQALGEVKRFDEMPHMNKALGDSTAAHSKQVMRLIWRLFNDAFGPSLPPGVARLRRDALMAAWIHDMGEIVLEFTTADDVFLMDAGARSEIAGMKDAMEHALFEFSCALAHYELDHPDRTGIFRQSILELREDARKMLRVARAEERGRAEAVKECMHGVRAGMERVRAELGLEAAPRAESQALLALYDRVEKQECGDFLHPLVKTIESCEGQRYLQRNDDCGGDEHRLELSTNLQVVESFQRLEKRLPLLFAQTDAGSPAYVARGDKIKLARATADFAYRTIIRSCDGKDTAIGRIPALIDRRATPLDEVPGDHLKPEWIGFERAKTQQRLALRRAAEPIGPDAAIYHRREVAELYEAARQELLAGRWRPHADSESGPALRSLIRLEAEGHAIPDRIARRMARQALPHEQGASLHILPGRQR